MNETTYLLKIISKYENLFSYFSYEITKTYSIMNYINAVYYHNDRIKTSYIKN